MGFRVFKQAAIHRARVYNGCLETDSGISIPIGIKENTKWQSNIFTDPRIAGVLYSDEIQYVLRFDGTYTGYTTDSDILIAQGKYALPYSMEPLVCGVYFISSANYVFIDPTNYRVLYVNNMNKEFTLKEHIIKDIYIEASYSSILNEERGLNVIYSDGTRVNEETDGTWYTSTCDRTVILR